MTQRNKRTLAEVRRDYLRDGGISVDYYEPHSGNRHCGWVCTDIDCDQCGNGFTSFPAFLKHLRVHHQITIVPIRWLERFSQMYYRA